MDEEPPASPAQIGDQDTALQQQVNGQETRSTTSIDSAPPPVSVEELVATTQEGKATAPSPTQSNPQLEEDVVLALEAPPSASSSIPKSSYSIASAVLSNTESSPQSAYEPSSAPRTADEYLASETNLDSTILEQTLTEISFDDARVVDSIEILSEISENLTQFTNIESQEDELLPNPFESAHVREAVLSSPIMDTAALKSQLMDMDKQLETEEHSDEECDGEALESSEPVFQSEFISSDLNKWFQKSYHGGFKNKKSGVEYFHSFTQTTTAHETKAMNAAPKAHRDTQTKLLHNRSAQSTVKSHTQMTRRDHYVSTDSDVVIEARKYISAAAYESFITGAVIQIQCFIRKCRAIRLVKRKRLEKKARSMALAAKEKRRKTLAEKRRKKEIESRLHPKSSKDFEILYNGLENWRLQETSKINSAGFSEPARLTALADLLDQEAALIQKIDRLKIVASEENKEISVVKLLDKMSSPKKWPIHSKKGGYCSVDTPNTIRARELRDLYHALNIPLLSVDERLQILLHVKYTVKEFDCNLTRDIVELIDREGDLVSRGREAKSLEGLRRRTSNLFLQFIQTPEFNPEAKLHQKFPNAGQSWKREQTVYYCRGCTKYLASTEFYLSTTMNHLGRCKQCTIKENIANQRKDDTWYLPSQSHLLSYVEMLKMARGQEGAKQAPQSATLPNLREGQTPYNAISLLQESDVRYLVDTIWNRQSAVSGNKNIEDLVLTRWDQSLELSPWNVILLTNAEASNHDQQLDPRDVYSGEFIRRVHQRHLAAKQHFAHLSYMAKYMKRQYVEGIEGKLVPRTTSENLEVSLSITGINCEVAGSQVIG